jgi:hypothetical protein
VRALGFLVAAIVGALACGGLLFTLGTLLALYAVREDRTFTLVIVGSTALGVLGGAGLGIGVFRWLAAPSDTLRPPDELLT